MTDTQAPRPGATGRVRLLVILGLMGLAVAIAAWVWLGNAGQAKECPVQAEDAAAIGDAATGELAALNGTVERLKQQAVAVGLPATLVLDENGCELGVLQGPAHWDTPDGEAVVQKMIELVS